MCLGYTVMEESLIDNKVVWDFYQHKKRSYLVITAEIIVINSRNCKGFVYVVKGHLSDG